MATWKLSFEDPAQRYLEEQYDAKDAAYWRGTLKDRAKPMPGDAGGVRALVEHLAPEYGVDPAFATAIAQTESNFQPSVVSGAGAKGVMQLMDPTARRFGVRDSFDPEQNIRGGLAYLAVLQDLFPGRIDLQMAAYNAGEGAVKKYGNTIPPYPETQEYVRRVSSRLAGGTALQMAQAPGPMQRAGPSAPGMPGAPASSAASPPTAAIPPGVPEGVMLPTVPTAGRPPSEAELGPLPTGEDVWMPAPKPIEKVLRGAGTFLGSIGAGFAKGTASLLEAPSTALRMAGVEGGITPLEQAASWVRETLVKPMEPLEARQSSLAMQIGEGIGQAGTFLVPGMGIERGVAAVASQAPKVAAMLGATTSGVLQGTVAMNDTYQALKPLVGDEEAGKRAQTAFLTNTVLGTVGSALGVFDPWVPGALSRVVVATVAQGAQGAVQYDWNRRLFWVPAEADNAQALTQMGWKRQGDRVVQPYHFKDQLEAAVVNAVVGGLFSAAHQAGRPRGGPETVPDTPTGDTVPGLDQLPIPEGLKAVAEEPGFSVPRALDAAMAPDAPPADVPVRTWQRWAQAVLDLLPEPGHGGLLRRILGSERGSISPERLRLRNQRRDVDTQLMALERGGDEAQQVVEALGVTSPDEAQAQLMAEREQVVSALEALPPEPPAAPQAAPTPAATVAGSAPVETPAPTTPPVSERLRTASGTWSTRLRDIPPQELELQTAIAQVQPDGRHGIRLTGETELVSEFRDLISPTRQENQPRLSEGIEVHGLLNNRTGLTPQEMAQHLSEHGFLGEQADKEALLSALQRSIVEGHDVYSIHATNHIPHIDSPYVAEAYKALQDYVAGYPERLAEQTRGVRPHALELEQATQLMAEGQWTPSDVAELVPGTAANAEMAAAVVLVSRQLSDQMTQAAARVVETGGRDQNAIQDYLTIKSYFAEVHTSAQGVRAEAGRTLSMLNDPLAAHNRYMDALRDLMLQHGQDTALKMARADLSLATPEDIALAAQIKREATAQAEAAFQERIKSGPLLGPEQDALRSQLTLFSADHVRETWAAVLGDPAELPISPTEGVPPLPNIYGPGLPADVTRPLPPRLTPQQRQDLGRQQRLAINDFVVKLREEAGLPSEAETFQRRHAAEPLSHLHDLEAQELPLFTPAELDVRLRAKLGWDLLTTEEQTAAKTAMQALAARYAGEPLSAYHTAVQPAGQLPLLTSAEMRDLQLELTGGYGPGLGEPHGRPLPLSGQELTEAGQRQRLALNDFLVKLREEAGLPSEAEVFRRRHEGEPLSHYNDPTDAELPLFTPGELNAHLQAKLGWDLLTPAEQAAAKAAVTKFARYQRAPGMGRAQDAGTPLMLDAPSRGPSDEALAREAGLPPAQRRAMAAEEKAALERQAEALQAQLRVIQANLGQSRPGLWQMYLEQWKASLLGVKTVLANAVSNTAMGIYQIPVRAMAAVASPARQAGEQGLNRVGLREGPVEPGVDIFEVSDMLYGMTHGWMDHLRGMASTWKTGESAVDVRGRGKGDVYPKAITAENLGLAGTIPGKIMEFWAEYIGFLSGGRTVFRVLNTTDEAFLLSGYAMERQVLAQREARLQGLQGLDRAERMAQVMLDPNVAERIHAEATETAKYNTLRADIPSTGMASWLTRMAQAEIPTGNIPIGNLLAPFHSVPTNAARAVVDNTPLGIFGKRFREDMAAGGRKADMALGRLFTGVLTTAAVAGLVGSLSITGRAPADPALRDIWLKEHPEDSAWVPGVGWVNYVQWLGWLGTAIKMVADTAQLMGELEGPLAQRAAATAYIVLSEDLIGQTAWKDLGEFFQIMNNGLRRRSEKASTVTANLMRYLRGEVLSHVGPGLSVIGRPSGTATGRMLVRADDPARKAIPPVTTTQGWLDALYAQTPGWSADVPLYYTITGEPMLTGVGVQGPDTLHPLGRALLPGVNPATAPLGPGDQAIQDNNMRLSKPTRQLLPIGVDEAASERETLKGIEGLTLTPRQYARLQVLSAMNETSAKREYQTTQQVIPTKLLQMVTQQATAKAYAAADPTTRLSDMETPPRQGMSLGEMYDWFATTKVFTDPQRASPGEGGGRDLAFKAITQTYHQWGQELFLELEPDVGHKHAQSKIQQQIERYPIPLREPLRLELDKGVKARRPAMREVMGMPPLTIGGP